MVLIADPDRETLRDLGKALHDRGYDVRAARDGSQALEKAILLHPDIVLIEAACPLIPARKFIQIIRSNPRTENIPIVVMQAEESDESVMWGYREAFIRKPYNTDEVLSLVASTFRKMATAQEVREESREIEGNLAQISLVDLLQIFGLNRRTGMLELKSQGAEAYVYIQEGAVVHASTGRHRGEKALFRMLEWREGTFAFVPEQVTGDINIRRGTDTLLLDGARQADELARLRQVLPSSSARLIAEGEIRDRFEGLHPVTREITNLLEFYHTIDDLVEHARASDFEVYRAVSTLLDKGIVQVVPESIEEPRREEKPLVGHDVLYELKLRVGQEPYATDRHTRAKICVLCPDAAFLKSFVGGLRNLPGMELAGQLEALRQGFGLIGTLKLSESFLFDWMLLPVEPRLKPLWHPLGVGMVGGLVLHYDIDDQGFYRLNLMTHELSQHAGIPLIQMVPEGDGSSMPSRVRNTVTRLLLQIAGLEQDEAATPP